MIKTEVRLTLWHEGGIHEDDFNQLMEDIMDVGAEFLENHHQNSRDMMASMAQKEEEDD